MKEIVIALLFWISAQTGYEVNVQPPRVVTLTHQGVVSSCIQGTMIPFAGEACYKINKHTIYIRDTFGLDHPSKVAPLVRELTRVLQLSNGRRFDIQNMEALEGEVDHVLNVFYHSPDIQNRIRQIYRVTANTTDASAVAGPDNGPLAQAPIPADNSDHASESDLITEPVDARMMKALRQVSEDLSGCSVTESMLNRSLQDREALEKDLSTAQEEILDIKDQLNTVAIEILALQKKRGELEALKKQRSGDQAPDTQTQPPQPLDNPTSDPRAPAVEGIGDKTTDQTPQAKIEPLSVDTAANVRDPKEEDRPGSEALVGPVSEDPSPKSAVGQPAPADSIKKTNYGGAGVLGGKLGPPGKGK